MHLDIHEHAEADLERLWESDPDAAAAIEVVLEEMQADPRLIDKLTQHGNNPFGQASVVNVKLWVSARNKRGNLWRFRVLNTPATKYRVVYGYHSQTRQVCVLAVAEKGVEFDYDTSSDLARRIKRDWLALD